MNLNTPLLLSANQLFHWMLVNGVPVENQHDFLRLIDRCGLKRVAGCESVFDQGPKYTCNPDIILFITGLPLVLLELKNSADENADIWKAYHQIETCKEQIPDVFQYNELLVIADGTEVRMSSLSSNVAGGTVASRYRSFAPVSSSF